MNGTTSNPTTGPGLSDTVSSEVADLVGAEDLEAAKRIAAELEAKRQADAAYDRKQEAKRAKAHDGEKAAAEALLDREQAAKEAADKAAAELEARNQKLAQEAENRKLAAAALLAKRQAKLAKVAPAHKQDGPTPEEVALSRKEEARRKLAEQMALLEAEIAGVKDTIRNADTQPAYELYLADRAPHDKIIADETEAINTALQELARKQATEVAALERKLAPRRDRIEKARQMLAVVELTNPRQKPESAPKSAPKRRQHNGEAGASVARQASTPTAGGVTITYRVNLTREQAMAASTHPAKALAVHFPTEAEIKAKTGSWYGTITVTAKEERKCDYNARRAIKIALGATVGPLTEGAPKTVNGGSFDPAVNTVTTVS